MTRHAAIPLVLLALLSVASAGCGGADEGATGSAGAASSVAPAGGEAPATTASGPASTTETAATDLRVQVWPAGRKAGASATVNLRCDPPGGDVPDPAAVCAALDGGPDPFAAPRDDVACTEVYGGPEEAEVTGTHRGRPVSLRLTRTNGCEIERWDAIVGALGGSTG
jgi:hypothetical protein